MRSDVYEDLKMALGALRAHKLRSFLTVVGVVIGVWTMMTIASIISGIDVAVKKEVESFGTRSIFLYKYDVGLRTSRPSSEERTRKELTLEDAAAVASLPAVELAVPNLVVPNSFFGQQTLVAGNGKSLASVRIEGTMPEYERAGIWTLSAGRFFTSYENEANKDVCVIGSAISESFFPNGSPVGRTLRIGGREFRVLGVFNRREQFLLGGEGKDDQNTLILIPFEVARKLRPTAEDLYVVAIARPGRMEEALEQITDLLRVRRHVPADAPNNFGMTTAATVTQTFHSITVAVALAMVVISSTGLLVAGIGVMNIMLVSVTERTREIGVRRAIGARRRDIRWQFLIEAMALTGIGGLLGLAAGWLTTLLINLFVPSYVPLWAPLAGFLASVGIGLAFGMWPASKAASLDPIQSLRYE